MTIWSHDWPQKLLMTRFQSYGCCMHRHTSCQVIFWALGNGSHWQPFVLFHGHMSTTYDFFVVFSCLLLVSCKKYPLGKRDLLNDCHICLTIIKTSQLWVRLCGALMHDNNNLQRTNSSPVYSWKWSTHNFWWPAFPLLKCSHCQEFLLIHQVNFFFLGGGECLQVSVDSWLGQVPAVFLVFFFKGFAIASSWGWERGASPEPSDSFVPEA